MTPPSSPPKKLSAKEKAQLESLFARAAPYSLPPPKPPATPQPKVMSTSKKAKAKKRVPAAVTEGNTTGTAPLRR
jgi:hypothetical protein